jgi:hypothetical protein
MMPNKPGSTGWEPVVNKDDICCSTKIVDDSVHDDGSVSFRQTHSRESGPCQCCEIVLPVCYHCQLATCSCTTITFCCQQGVHKRCDGVMSSARHTNNKRVPRCYCIGVIHPQPYNVGCSGYVSHVSGLNHHQQEGE